MTPLAQHLIGRLSRSTRVTVMIVAGVVGLWLMVAMYRSMQPAVENSIFGIVSFELAGTPQQATAILDSWGEAGRVGAERAIKLDYGFLVAYSVLLALASGTVALGAARREWHRTEQVAWRVASWSPVAGLLDAVENTALLTVLRQYDSGGVVGSATVVADAVAGLKFAIVVAGFGFVIVVLGAFVNTRFRRPKPNRTSWF